jgi:hypothetical protein
MFERGKEYERGLRPLSFGLPFPAIDIFGGLRIRMAGKGT